MMHAAVAIPLVLAFTGQAPPAEGAGTSETNQAERLRAMQGIADRVTLHTDASGERRQIARVGEPVYKYVDPARRHANGAVWAWGRSGRPEALLTLSTYHESGGAEAWLYEFTSLAPTPLVGSLGDGRFWAPAEPGIQQRPIPNAPAPAGDDRTRLRQMKELTRRVKGFEYFVPPGQGAPERYELRLLSQPVCRYSDPASGLIDGAVFLFVYGTDPEVALLVEATRAGTPAPVWKYALARIAGAELHVELDEHEVWTKPAVRETGARAVYWFCSKPLNAGS